MEGVYTSFVCFSEQFNQYNILSQPYCSHSLQYLLSPITLLITIERFAGMYSSWAYAFAQVTIELPYSFIMALVITMITYPMIGYYSSAYKILWYFYAMFCTVVYFSYLAMVLVSVTPNVQMASIIASGLYALMNLFSGFPIPQPHIPKWWLWLSYASPTYWTLNALLSSQYGDIHDNITVYGAKNTDASFIQDYFGFYQHHLGLSAAMLLVFPLTFALLFGYFIGKLNFQTR